MMYADIVLPLAQPTYSFAVPEGVELTYTQTQLSDIILQVAADEKDYPDLLDWLLCHQN